jgi:hypothetical protein
MREKWDERRGAQTYGEVTIEKAIAGCHETYRGEIRSVRRAEPAATTQPLQPARAGAESLILDPADPLPSARAFVDRTYVADDVLALRHQGGVS